MYGILDHIPFGGLAQQVERLFCRPKVRGSKTPTLHEHMFIMRSQPQLNTTPKQSGEVRYLARLIIWRS